MAVTARGLQAATWLVTALLVLPLSCTKTEPPRPKKVSDTLPKVVASVNGVNIEREAVLERLDQARTMMAHQQHMSQSPADVAAGAQAASTQAPAPLSPAEQARQDAEQEKELLHSIINQMVLEELKKQEAARLGLRVAPEQLEANVKRIEEQSGSRESLEEQLRQGHTTIDQWRTQLHQALLFQALEARRRAATPVSDEEIRQYWEQNRATLAQLWNTTRLDQVRDRIRALIQQSRWPAEEAQWYQELVRSAKIWVDPAVRQQLARPPDHAHPGEPPAAAQAGAPKG
ncbi:SurA N-terminal domain-containing protein [Nitrospira sp. Kam-Ns4a]